MFSSLVAAAVADKDSSGSSGPTSVVPPHSHSAAPSTTPGNGGKELRSLEATSPTPNVDTTNAKGESSVRQAEQAGTGKKQAKRGKRVLDQMTAALLGQNIDDEEDKRKKKKKKKKDAGTKGKKRNAGKDGGKVVSFGNLKIEKPYRPKSKRPPALRMSLVERAGHSKTREYVEKLTETEMESKKNGVTLGSPTRANEKVAKIGMELLESITEESNELVRQIERQKRTLEQQQVQIGDVAKQLDLARKELRRQLKATDASQRGVPKREGFIVRLDALHTKLNDARTRERVLRKKIDNMRHQQVDDMNLQRELLMERAKLRDEREDIIQQTKEVREREVELRDTIQKFKEKADTKIGAMKAEWQALGVFVDAKSEKEKTRLWNERREQELKAAEEETKRREEAQKALMHFSPFSPNKKNPPKQQPSFFKKQTTSKASVANFGTHYNHHGSVGDISDMALAGNLTVNEEKQLKSNIQQSRWQIARGQVALQSLESKATTLEEGFSMIKAKTGIETPAKMVETFLQREEEIFRLFTHVNLLSEQIEELESSVEVEREEIERYRGKDGETKSGRSIIKQLDDRLDRLTLRTTKHEEVGQTAARVIDQIKASVASMFVRIGCDTKLIENFVFHAGTAGVSELNNTFGRSKRTSKAESTSGGDASSDTNNVQQDQQQQRDSVSSSNPVEPTSPAVTSPTTTTKKSIHPTSPNSARVESKRKNLNRQKTNTSKRTTLPEDDVDSVEMENINTKQFEITEKNLLQYFGVIEQRVSELVMIYNILMRHKPTDHGKDQRPVRPLPSLPSTERDMDDWSDDDADGETLRPLRYDELIGKVAAKGGKSTKNSHNNSNASNGHPSNGANGNGDGDS